MHGLSEPEDGVREQWLSPTPTDFVDMITLAYSTISFLDRQLLSNQRNRSIGNYRNHYKILQESRNKKILQKNVGLLTKIRETIT